MQDQSVSNSEKKAPVQPNETKAENVAASGDNEALSAKEKAAKAVKNVDFERKLNATVSSIFSRCGIPISDFTISEPVSLFAKVNYTLNWSFKCRATDKPAGKVSDETNILSTSGLDEFTQKNSKELEKESTVTSNFIKRLAAAKFKELSSLSGQIVAFNRIAAIGRTRCKKCHGSKTAVCDDCKGKGSRVCPGCGGLGGSCSMCGGRGKLVCSACGGVGKYVCKNCKGRGELIVEREIIYDAECKKKISMSLTLPNSNETITSFSKEDEKVILDAANFEDQSSGNETSHGYNATFAGYSPCFAVTVHLKDYDKPFYFILCGKSLRPICKPALLDVVFNRESHILADTLNIASTDVDEKINCVKTLAAKSILTKTIRSIEGYELEIMKKEAAKTGSTVESVLRDAKHGLSPNIKAHINEELIENVANELVNNAQGFVSHDFARYFAKNLIDFVPMLMLLNPNSKTVWAGITLATWMINGMVLYFMPTLVCAFLCVMMSVMICILTSVLLTKNWTYYSAVSALRLTHKLKKVPNLTSEAILSARLLIGSLVINIVAVVINNSSF